MNKNLAEYSWWGSGENDPPDNLKTKKQLNELGLSARQPVAYIPTKKYYCYLYDINNSESVRPKRKPTEKQLQALDLAREKQRKIRAWKDWLEFEGMIEHDRVAAVLCCRDYLENKDKYVILDTETTGLDDAQIVEIAIIKLDGEAILNTLVKPTIPIPLEVTHIHGITDNMVKDAPTFPEVYPLIVEAVKDKIVLIYNKSFDIRILNYCRNIHKLPSFKLSDRSECLMELYAQWYGEYSHYHGDYKWQPLCSEHRAMGDCLANLEAIKIMAEDSDKINYPDGIDPME